MEQPEMMPPPLPQAAYEIDSSQYFTTLAPDQSPPPSHHDYYTSHGGPPMPPPPLAEPHGATPNSVLDPLLQTPPPVPATLSDTIVNAAKAERTAQDRERGRLRVQRFRMKRKLADAEAGKRDKETLKKIKFPPSESQGDANNGQSSSEYREPTVKDTEAEMRERERGRLRVQAYRMRKKLAEAKDGMRDPNTLKKLRNIRTGELSTLQPEPVAQPPSYQPAMLPPTHDAMAHYQDTIFNVPVEAPSSMLPPPPLPSPPTKTEAPAVTPSTFPQSPNQIATSSRQRAVRTNWFHPSRWSTINAAGLRANFSSAHEIVRLAKLAPGGEETFKTLDRGTVHKWIDKERGAWTESVAEKVRKAALKEAQSWGPTQGQGPEGMEDEQPQVDMGIYGPPPALEGMSSELDGVSQFQVVGAHDTEVMNGSG